MFTIREATPADVEGIRDVFEAEYGGSYAYPQYYDVDVLARMVTTTAACCWSPSRTKPARSRAPRRSCSASAPKTT